MSVLLVDDHELVAETLAVSLRAAGIDVVRCGSILQDAVLASIEEYRPHLVLLDLDLGGRDRVAPDRTGDRTGVASRHADR